LKRSIVVTDYIIIHILLFHDRFGLHLKPYANYSTLAIIFLHENQHL